MANFFKELFAGERSIWTGARNENYYDRQTEQNAASTQAAAVKEAEPSTRAAEQKAAEDIRTRQKAIKRNKTIFTSPLGLGVGERSNLMLKTLTGE